MALFGGRSIWGAEKEKDLSKRGPEFAHPGVKKRVAKKVRKARAVRWFQREGEGELQDPRTRTVR